MANVFEFNTLTEADKRALMSDGSGAYLVNLRNLSADNIDRKSKGFSRKAITILMKHRLGKGLGFCAQKKKGDPSAHGIVYGKTNEQKCRRSCK